MTDRYARQIALPEVGAAGQARLAQASVLVVGAGGLGCAVLPYLCAAGIGRLIVVDHDCVDESNLHRQPLYRMHDVEALKAPAARKSLLELNPAARVDAVCEALTPANAQHLVASADWVVDAADSFAVSYILSDECLRAHKPLVSASALALAGYVGVYCGGAPSYRAVFPELPAQAGTCAQNGVLGAAVGVIGTLQAQMVLSGILGITPSVKGQLVSVDFREMRFGGFRFASAQEPAEQTVLRFIAATGLSPTDVAVDLRTSTEMLAAPFNAALRSSVEDIARLKPDLPRDRRVVLCCRSGLRAWRAARILQAGGWRNLALIALG